MAPSDICYPEIALVCQNGIGKCKQCASLLVESKANKVCTMRCRSQWITGQGKAPPLPIFSYSELDHGQSNCLPNQYVSILTHMKLSDTFKLCTLIGHSHLETAIKVEKSISEHRKLSEDITSAWRSLQLEYATKNSSVAILCGSTCMGSFKTSSPVLHLASDPLFQVWNGTAKDRLCDNCGKRTNGIACFYATTS